MERTGLPDADNESETPISAGDLELISLCLSFFAGETETVGLSFLIEPSWALVK